MSGLTGTSCPVCEQKAYYVAEAGQYYHRDGSDNRNCWRIVRVVHKLHVLGEDVSTLRLPQATVDRVLARVCPS